jgi:hypothetical protein
MSYVKVVGADYGPVIRINNDHVFTVGSSHKLPGEAPVVAQYGFHFARTTLECLAALVSVIDPDDRGYRLVTVEPDGAVAELDGTLAALALRVTGEVRDWQARATGRLLRQDGSWMKFNCGVAHQDDDDPEPAESTAWVQAWWQKGRRGRHGSGPHRIHRGSDFARCTWYDANGHLHRPDDQPAIVDLDGSGRAVLASWKVHGQPQRADARDPVAVAIVKGQFVETFGGVGDDVVWDMADGPTLQLTTSSPSLASRAATTDAALKRLTALRELAPSLL